MASEQTPNPKIFNSKAANDIINLEDFSLRFVVWDAVRSVVVKYVSSLKFKHSNHPAGKGRSLSDEQIAYRCPYGYSLIDVLTEIH